MKTGIDTAMRPPRRTTNPDAEYSVKQPLPAQMAATKVGRVEPGRKALRIAMVAYTFYESDGRVIRYAEALAKRGDHIEVIALKRQGETPSAFINGVHVCRIQKRVRNERSKFSYLAKTLLFLLRAGWFLTRRSAHVRFDLIHVHSMPDFLILAAAVPKLMGTKVILDIHDLLPEYYSSRFGTSRESVIFRLLLLVERMSAAVADHLITANHIWEEKLSSRAVHRTKCTTFMNYPDRSIFSRPLKSWDEKRPDEKFLILYPGSLNYHQGVDTAIRAFTLLGKQLAQAEFHIYGEGPAKESLVRLAAELGVQDRVIFHGILPLKDIAKVMQKADLGVVPKRADSFGNEAFSTKILEFMCAGVPLLVSDTAIDRYYFNSSVVRFFRSTDEEDLAKQMLELSQDRKARQQLAQNGHEFSEKYSWEKHKEVYFQLVDLLCGRISHGEALSMPLVPKNCKT